MVVFTKTDVQFDDLIIRLIYISSEIVILAYISYSYVSKYYLTSPSRQL